MAPRPYRQHKCVNGHIWRAPVSFGRTFRLSGERPTPCPECGRDATFSEPWTTEDGSPYPFDTADRTIPDDWKV